MGLALYIHSRNNVTVEESLGRRFPHTNYIFREHRCCMADHDTEVEKYATQLASKSESKTITVQNLLGTSPFTEKTNNPPISYISDDEVPKYIYNYDTNEILLSVDDKTSKITGKSIIIITDLRFLVVNAKDGADDVYSIPLNNVISVDIHLGEPLKNLLYGSSNAINIEFEGGYIQISGTRKKTLKNIANEISNGDISRDGHLEYVHYTVPSNVKYYCTKCAEEVAENATKCPHCGFSPTEKKKGALWHGTGLALAFSPIGWAMMAKGAADEVASKQNLSTAVPQNTSSIVESDSDDDDVISKLEKLTKLYESGTLTEEEFENLKSRIID